MCMEDKIIGRESYTAITTIIDPGGSVFRIPENGSRVALIVAPPAAGRITVFPSGADTSTTCGFNITNNGVPFEATIEVYGDAVTKDWAIGDDGLAHNICYIEVFLGRRK